MGPIKLWKEDAVALPSCAKQNTPDRILWGLVKLDNGLGHFTLKLSPFLQRAFHWARSWTKQPQQLDW